MSPKIIDKEQRRSDILQAALRVFSTRGYHRSRVEDIAVEADVSKGTIYLYFESREAILIAAFDQFMLQLGEGAKETLELPIAPLEKIRLLLKSSFESFAANETLSRVMMDFWAASVHNPDMPNIALSDVYREYRTMISELLDEAKQRGDIRSNGPGLTPNIIMAVIDGLALHWMIDPALVSLDRATDDFFELLTRGLGTTDVTPAPSAD